MIFGLTPSDSVGARWVLEALNARKTWGKFNMALLVRGKTALSPRRNAHGVQHRLHAFRAHLAASGRGSKLLKNVKHSPESSPCPPALLQTPLPISIAKNPMRNCDSRLQPSKTGHFLGLKNVFKVVPRRADQRRSVQLN